MITLSSIGTTKWTSAANRPERPARIFSERIPAQPIDAHSPENVFGMGDYIAEAYPTEVIGHGWCRATIQN